MSPWREVVSFRHTPAPARDGHGADVVLQHLADGCRGGRQRRVSTQSAGSSLTGTDLNAYVCIAHACTAHACIPGSHSWSLSIVPCS